VSAPLLRLISGQIARLSCRYLRSGAKDVFDGIGRGREQFAFFPDIYNEDWFFFADEGRQL
jgi:hypothetical protein